MTTKICSIDGCERKFLARGLCSMHYNAAHRKPNPVAEFQCAECGTTFTKERARANRYKNLYCSLMCRDNHRHRESRLSRSQVQVYKPQPLWHTAHQAYKVKHARVRVLTAGYCAVCSKPFVDSYGSKACSDECQKEHWASLNREIKQRRRARKRDAFVSPVNRRRIFERDEYTCQLCGERLSMDEAAPHPQSPSIDHVIALANGGTHEPSNVQAAHYICNSIKGDREWVGLAA